jgi:hypothetical protein
LSIQAPNISHIQRELLRQVHPQRLAHIIIRACESFTIEDHGSDYSCSSPHH